MTNFSRRPEEGIRHGGGKIPKVKPLGYYVQDTKFGFDIIRRTVIQWIKQYYKLDIILAEIQMPIIVEVD